MWIHIGANVTVGESTVDANVVRDAPKQPRRSLGDFPTLLTLGGAAFVFMNAQLTVYKTEVCHNEASLSEGQQAEGGGFYAYASAQLVVSESLLCHNKAENGRGGIAHGGAISGSVGCLVTVVRSVVERNTARGALYAKGGAIYMSKLSEANFVETAFWGNNVDGAIVHNRGGAVYLDDGGKSRFSDSEFRNNSATFKDSHGGAIWSSAQSLVLINTSLLQNRVTVSMGQGFGGAVSVSAGFLRLVGCRVHSNVAESLTGSGGVGGGAIHLLAGVVHIEGSSLRGNIMGGLGVAQAEASAKVGGTHMLAQGGDIVLDSCSVTDDGGSVEEARLENAGKWWLLAAQSLVLRNSSFHSATPEQGLLNIIGPQTQLMIRGCTFENVRIGVADGVKMKPIGVVDSTFTPALDSSIPTVQPTSASGSCAVELAGEQICDARALCEGVSSGGVRCSCVGSGLRYKPDVPEDGRQCAQDTSVRAVLETESLIIAVVKPSNLTNSTMTLIVEARGEAELAVAFNIVVTRLGATSGDMIATNRSIHIDQPSISVFGQHIEWKRRPPAATWHADLDGGRFKFADTLRHEFRLRIACDRAEQSRAARPMATSSRPSSSSGRRRMTD
jgi:hypothetical protein